MYFRGKQDLASVIQMPGVFGHFSFSSQSSLSQGQTERHAPILQQDLGTHRPAWAPQAQGADQTNHPDGLRMGQWPRAEHPRCEVAGGLERWPSTHKSLLCLA